MPRNKNLNSMNSLNNMSGLNNFTLELNKNETRILLTVVIVLIIALLFRKSFHNIIEKIIVFAILFLLFLVITKNIVVTFIGTCIIFLLVNLIINYQNTIENFEDQKGAEPAFDMNIFNKDDVKKSSDSIQDLLKKINGGIELKEDDIKETDELKIDVLKYGDDKKPNALKDAQKETYELINTVNALKDTITTLAPVLQEGKKLMNIFENLKI
jgi:hypothetical protein